MQIIQKIKGWKPEYDTECVLQVYSVEDEFIGLLVTEASGPFNWSRKSIELHDVNEITELRDFLNQMLEKMRNKIHDE
jgi:hypothetical protein